MQLEEFDVSLFVQLLEGLEPWESSCVSLLTVESDTMSRAKHWCFTLNNYTAENIAQILGAEDQYNYVIFGKEVGENGTPHLQGFVSFPSRVRLNYCTQTIGQAHYSVARNVDHSIQYCKKDGDYVEIGQRPVANTRNDLESFKSAVAGGELDMGKLRAEFSEVVAKYPKFALDFVADHMPKKVVSLYPLRLWQQSLYQTLLLPPEERKIIFIVDPVGNSGKSWFSHYYCFLHDNAQVLLPGKKADMSYALNPLIRVLFVDAPRSKQGEYLQYDFLEDVKNGYVFCSKYESRVKQLMACHVVVMMNEDPDMSKLSMDRYCIRRVT
jgi:Putative viral replication protein